MISVNPKAMATVGAHVRPPRIETTVNRLGYNPRPLPNASEAVEKALKGEFPAPMLTIPYVTESEREGQQELGKNLQPAAAVDAFKANLPAAEPRERVDSPLARPGARFDASGSTRERADAPGSTRERKDNEAPEPLPVALDIKV